MGLDICLIYGEILSIKSDCLILAGELDEKFVNTAKKWHKKLKLSNSYF